MPLIRRIPKRGFNNASHTIEYIPVNLGDLEQFDNGAKVDELALRSVGLANGRLPRIKILGTGELTKKLTISAHAFSASARAKIEAKGGTCETLVLHAPKPPKPAKAPKAAKPAQS
jgi:large subunit ribosomal protein L15